MALLFMCFSCHGDGSSKAQIFRKEILLIDTTEIRVNDVFQIPARGKYVLSVDLYQKTPTHGSPMQVAGEVKIFDTSGTVLGMKVINQGMRANQVGLDLWIFDAKELGGAGARRLEILVSGEGTGLHEQYTRAVVYIIPKHKRGFLD